MTLASFYGCTGRFESYLGANPEDRFSREEAQMMMMIQMDELGGLQNRKEQNMYFTTPQIKHT